MTINAEALTRDLIERTERAVTTIAHLAVDTGVTFTIADVVAAVERDLPAGYPAPSIGGSTRGNTISQMAQAILSGKLYEGS